MKTKELVRHLRRQGCELLREGSRHSIYHNSKTGQLTAVPRHKETEKVLVREICKQLGITGPD